MFNPDTLSRVKFITDELRKFNAVDRYKILSIAHQKVRDMKMTSQGYISKPLMWPEVPQTDEELEKLRGVPVVLNTSLNRRGEPIVCTPSDALDMFYGSDLQYLFIEDLLVRKEK